MLSKINQRQISYNLIYVQTLKTNEQTQQTETDSQTQRKKGGKRLPEGKGSERLVKQMREIKRYKLPVKK